MERLISFRFRVLSSCSDPNDRTSPFGSLGGIGRASNAGSSGNGSDDSMMGGPMTYDLSDDIVGNITLDDTLFNPLAGMRPSSAFDNNNSSNTNGRNSGASANGVGGSSNSRSSSSRGGSGSHRSRASTGGHGDLPVSAVFGEPMANGAGGNSYRYGGGSGGSFSSSGTARIGVAAVVSFLHFMAHVFFFFSVLFS